jgi:ribonuclease BN (tRNA processing enzyme)
MKLYLIGCNGWIPGENETSCFLIEHKNKLLMLDLGTGVSNLVKYKKILEKYDEITVILSHYHLDHTIGIIYLLPYLKEKKLTIYGPGKPYYSFTTEEYLSNLLRNEFFSRPLLKIAKKVVCLDYTTQGFKIGDIQVGIKEQIHSAPSFQINIDRKLIYATDTAFQVELFSNIAKNTILLHECWDAVDLGNAKHSALPLIMDGLKNIDFEKVILIHLNPEWSFEERKTVEEKILGTKYLLGKDGMTFEF